MATAELAEVARQAVVMQACAGPDGFRYFLPYWQFVNRETGEPSSFATLWRGQAEMVELMAQRRLFLLKAGKLGATELACAYDGWVLRFGPRNARVHLFSLDLDASTELLRIVRYGLDHLPAWMRLPVAEGQAGADTSRSLVLDAGEDDRRTVKSWPAREHVSIDQTAHHVHLDEWCRMRWAVQVLQAVQSTVAPGGSLHIISRGAGPNAQARLYREALAGRNEYRAAFIPWSRRPRPPGWREREARNYTAAGIAQFAPETWQEALQGDESYVYPQFEAPPGRHVRAVDPCPPHLCERLVMPVDPGLVNPTAVLLMGERTSGGVHVYDEFYRPGVGLDEIGGQMAAWWREHGLARYTERTRDWVYVPVPGDEKTLMATLNSFFRAQRLGMLAVPATRELRAGIQLVTQRLNSNALTVAARCERLREEFLDYRNTVGTDTVTKVQYAGERPVRHHADALDALRYGMHQLAAWPQRVVRETATGRRVLARV